MRSGIFIPKKKRDYNREEMNDIEKALHVREKNLKRNEEILQRKINDYKKRSNWQAKADLRAAAKLHEARRKLLFALDSRDKLKECHPRNCKANKNQKKLNNARPKGKRKKLNPFTDIVVNLCESLISGPCRRNNVLNPVLDVRQCRLNSRDLPFALRPSRNDSTRNISHKANFWNSVGADCYIKSLRRTPQIWIYHRWPKFYPHYINVRKQWRNLGYFTLFIAGFLLWAPMLLCLELCKCFFCACCYDF